MICKNSFASDSATSLGCGDFEQYPSSMDGIAASSLSFCLRPIARLMLSASLPVKPQICCRNLIVSSWYIKSVMLHSSLRCWFYPFTVSVKRRLYHYPFWVPTTSDRLQSYSFRIVVEPSSIRGLAADCPIHTVFKPLPFAAIRCSVLVVWL